MKTIAKLLIIVTELAIRCRAGLPWQSFEPFNNDHLVGWSGEDNWMLTEKTAQYTSLGSDHHLSPQPNHASSPRTSTTAPTSEPLPRGTDLAGMDFHRVMEDHFLRPVDSHHDIHSPPMEIDPPPMAIDSPLMEIDSPPTELEEDIAQPDVGAAAAHIHINEKEVPEYQLVFHENVFSASPDDRPSSKNKLKIIREEMKKTSSDQGQLSVFVVVRELLAFICTFNYPALLTNDPKKGPGTTDMAGYKITTCLIHSDTWRAVYHRRLGIDFDSAEKWFEDTIKRESSHSVHKLLPKINKWFLIYIILVDVIITILPNGNQQEHAVDRIQSFQTAVRCFEDYTRLTLQSPEGLGNTRNRSGIAIIWRFVNYWKENNVNYAWLELPSQGHSHLSWKNFFNFIFAHSMEHFSTEFKKALESKVSH